MKHQLFGAIIEQGSIDYCAMGQDHYALVEEAIAARRKLEKDVDNSSVVCARCIKAIRLKS